MKKLVLLLTTLLAFSTPSWALLGDLATDLVFTPVTPCRIFDTRTSQGGTGPIPANGIKNFVVYNTSSYVLSGGSNTNCGIAAGINTAAIAINLTVVTPNTGGWITAFPFGTAQPVAATVNFNAGDIRGNMAILKVDQNVANPSSLSIFSTSATEVIGDIVGFYSRPQATALECMVTAAIDLPLAAGSSGSPVAPACPATFAITETQCLGGNFSTFLVGTVSGTCFAINTGTTPSNMAARNRCCRVPGR
jgi:hypothetical protein